MMCSSCEVSWLYGVDLAFADLLAGGEEFPARALGEGVGADRVEQVVGGLQVVAGVEPAVLPAEPLTVEQVRPGQVGPQRSATQPLDRLGVALLGLPALADQRSRARLQALRPVGTLNGRHGRQPAQRFPGQVRPSGPHGGLDQFGQNQLRAQG